MSDNLNTFFEVDPTTLEFGFRCCFTFNDYQSLSRILFLKNISFRAIENIYDRHELFIPIKTIKDAETLFCLLKDYAKASVYVIDTEVDNKLKAKIIRLNKKIYDGTNKNNI